MVTLDERLLDAPHSHLIGLMEWKEDVGEKGPVHLQTMRDEPRVIIFVQNEAFVIRHEPRQVLLSGSPSDSDGSVCPQSTACCTYPRRNHDTSPA